MTGAAALAVAIAPMPAIAETTPTAAQSPSGASTPVRPAGSSVVTLVTGDRVRLSEYDDGRTSVTLLRGSPSYAKPVQTMHTPDATYVIPRLSAAVRKRLDYSMFDVQALSAQPAGPVEVKVRFADGVAAHDVSGLDVDESSARSTGAGTVASATYAPGDAADPSQWAGIASVRLAAAPIRTRTGDDDYVMRTLTIKAKGRDGRKPPYVDAQVINVEDGRLFNGPVAIENGVGKVSVPEGEYAVIGTNLGWIASVPQFTVKKDTSVTLDGSKATVKPRLAIKGARLQDREISVLRTAEKTGSYTLSFGGVLPRVQPVTRRLRNGGMRTFLGSTAVQKSKSRRIYTKDGFRGVPRDLTFTYDRGDFARMAQRYYAVGTDRADTYAVGFAKGEQFAFSTYYRVRPPVRRSMWLLGRSEVRWRQGVEVFGRDHTAAQSTVLGRYKPGRVRPMAFGRAPVGPGIDRDNDSSGTGRYCWFCRDGNELRGVLPLWNGAGTAQFGSFWRKSMGSWTLRAGRKTLDKGAYAIEPKVTVPAKHRAYTLEATSAPGFGPKQLSSRVSTQWRFTSGKGKRVVPLLMPSYVPPIDLRGRTKPGKIGYRLNLSNLGPVESRIKKASVRYSTNGGKKWRKARVRRIDKNSFRVQYRNPAAAGKRRYVSLRVKAKDTGGRSVQETAIRAYRLTRGKRSSAATRPTVADGSTSVAATNASIVKLSSVADRPATRRDPGQADGGRRACEAAGPRAYRCFALIERSGRDALTRAGDPAGWGAVELRDAYGLPENPKPGQKIAVVVAYDFPTAAADMNKYRRQYGLPLCKIKGGCFTKINQRGEKGDYPKPDPGWAMEAALDLQMISAACPKCKIVLAEADNPSVRSIGKAVDAAVDAGAVVTNHSYGLYEYGGVTKANRKYARDGVTAVAASGDYGFEPASFPASSSDVLAVGGTVLHHAANNRGWRENAWQYAGSGCSAYFSGPDGQDDPSCEMRTIADVSAVSDGVAVYNSFSGRGKRKWWVIGGTSASSPLIAGMIAAAKAGGMKPDDVYAADPDGYFDVRRGSNGFCKRSYLCTAKPGYDGPTGLGTPRGLDTFRTP